MLGEAVVNEVKGDRLSETALLAEAGDEAGIPSNKKLSSAQLSKILFLEIPVSELSIRPGKVMVGTYLLISP